MDITDIPDAELTTYIKRLMPMLLKKRSGEWTPIRSIANNPNRFLDIVQCLADYRFFDDREGALMLELSNDSLCIRVTPYHIDNKYDIRRRWKFDNITI